MQNRYPLLDELLDLFTTTQGIMNQLISLMWTDVNSFPTFIEDKTYVADGVGSKEELINDISTAISTFVGYINNHLLGVNDISQGLALMIPECDEYKTQIQELQQKISDISISINEER